MGKALLNILLLVIGSVAAHASKVEDDPNLVIENRVAKYDLVPGTDGKLASIKVRDEMRFSAKRVDEQALAYTHYHDKITVDKASAPGAKVKYVQNFSDGTFYDDMRTCIMTFPVKAGKEAKAVFETTITDPTQFCDIWFDRFYPVDTYTIEINVPAQLASKMRFDPRHLPAGTQLLSTADAKGNLRYDLTLKDVKAFKSEPLGMPSTLCNPRIMVSGVFDGVEEVYRYLMSFVDQNEPVDDAVAQLAASLTAGCGDDIAKIDTIASWVRQNIRYVGIEHGEYAHKPDAATSVLKKRYGDCKGSANLIKAMLKSTGIDGRLCWIGTYPQIDFTWEEYPSIGAGNHLIAAAVLSDTIIYIDGTASYLPKGYIPNSIQGQKAMIENGETPLLVDVPRRPVDSSIDKIKAAYAVADGKLSGHIHRKLTGTLCSVYDNAFNMTSSDRRDLMLVKNLSTDRKSVSVSNVDYRRSAPNAPCAFIDYDIVDQSALTTSTKADYVAIDLLRDEFVEPVDTDDRQGGVLIKMPYKYMAEATLDVPEGYADVVLPEDYTIDNKWYEGAIKYTRSDDKIKIVCEIAPRELTASPDELAEWNKVVKEARKASARRLKFVK